MQPVAPAEVPVFVQIELQSHLVAVQGRPPGKKVTVFVQFEHSGLHEWRRPVEGNDFCAFAFPHMRPARLKCTKTVTARGHRKARRANCPLHCTKSVTIESSRPLRRHASAISLSPSGFDVAPADAAHNIRYLSPGPHQWPVRLRKHNKRCLYPIGK